MEPYFLKILQKDCNKGIIVRFRYSYKSLYNAAHIGDVEKLLKIIASGLNPNHIFEENNNETALHVAAGNGHLPAVHILLQAKAQINVLDGEQNTPLTAAINAKHNDIVKYLIKCGADLVLKVLPCYQSDLAIVP